ncbi:hypothetical protein tb265_41720 [Gemmatimonadetes bacterium T265]|nr:hypothetical protein tb265_41720 [Gemmatimonadetes bacterium T265]
MGVALSLPLPEAGEPVYYSAEMVDALNDAVEGALPRYECVYGELFVTVSPPRPWHQEVCFRLFDALRAYARREPAAGSVGLLQSKFTFRRADTNVSPDVWAVRTEEWRALDWEALAVPLLLAEVLSPSTRRWDRFAKRRAYIDAGVPLYWIVDADAHSVDVWTPGLDFPPVERERLVWHPEGAREPFALDLAELFAPV